MTKQKAKQNLKKVKQTRVKSPQPKQSSKTAVSRSSQSNNIEQSIKSSTPLSPDTASGLQQTIGNQAVGRLLIQPKLTLGPVGDKYEQEADAVAKQVVSHLSTSGQPTAQRQEEEELQMKPVTAVQHQEEEEELQMKPVTAVQRQEEEELQMKPVTAVQRQEEEEELQMKPVTAVQRQEEEELQMKPVTAVQRQEEKEELQMKPVTAVQRQEEEELQMKAVTAVQRQGETGSGGGEISADIEQSIQSARVAGQPLADNVRTPMENAFGTDFSGVKVHTDSQSDTLNQSLQARAFTTGQDIFFRQGEYNPGGSGGQELLAHELTHVVQQTGGGQLQRSPRNDKAQQEQAHEADSTDTASHQSPSTAETHSSHESVSTFRLTARIRRAETPIMNSERLTAHSEPSIVNSDSLPGEEHVETEEKPEDPEEMAQITITDKLTPALTYNATITHGGITPGAREFGLTNWTANVSGLNVKTVPSAFEVTATVNCPIKWEVHSLGRTDIDDSLSAAITKANYPTVASDLTPNMSSDGGRPPRTKFWAQDLTEQHEKYHADEFKTYGQASFTLAQTWLGTQTANSAAKAKELVKKIPGRMRTNLIATYVPNCETRAYGDGAPHYKKRADEVSLNGAAGKYK